MTLAKQEIENSKNSPSELAKESQQKKPQTDMMATARAAQIDGAELGKKAGAIKLVAPAKVNLFLGIGKRRADGYHSALSILHALNLHDELYMRALPGAPDSEGLTIRLHTTVRGGVEPFDLAPEDNIVYHAIAALAQRMERVAHETIEVNLEKYIPAQGGLGGGSSDAAAALVGAAHLWGVSPESPLLEEVAHGLGSDVAFFLHGGCARFGGTGELFEQQLTAMKGNVVLIRPSDGVSTAEAYRVFDTLDSPIDEATLLSAEEATRAEDIPFFNNLAAASEQLLPALSEINKWAKDFPGAEEALLCGSGSATFVTCDSFESACRLAAAARQKGWWSRVTAFGSLRATMVSKR